MSYTPVKPKGIVVNWTLDKLDFPKNLPSSLLRKGRFIMGSSVLMLGLMAWLLEYNDTLKAPITISTKAMPLDVLAQSSGTLQLLVKDNEIVKKEQVLAVLKNTADYKDIQWLQQTINPTTTRDNLQIAVQLSQALRQVNIGVLQTDLAGVHQQVERLQIHQETEEHEVLIASKQGEIAHYHQRIALLKRKAMLIDSDIGLATKQLSVDASLFEDSVISARSLDMAKQTQLAKSYGSLDNEANINEFCIRIKKLEQEIVQLKSQYRQTKEQLEQNILQAMALLQSNLREWERQYLLLADMDGTCAYNNYLNNHQYIHKGEKVFTLLPQQHKEYIGLLQLPIKGAGKVQAGQTIHIRLDNYPADEFGILKGAVETIAPIPNQGAIQVAVRFPQGLISTYDIPFAFQQMMQGQGEIVTQKMSFLDRIWNQVRDQGLNR